VAHNWLGVIIEAFRPGCKPDRASPQLKVWRGRPPREQPAAVSLSKAAVTAPILDFGFQSSPIRFSGSQYLLAGINLRR